MSHPARFISMAMTRFALRALLVSLTVSLGLVAAPTALALKGGACNGAWDPAIIPSDFTDTRGRPNAINNAYSPLRPGTTYVYEGTIDGLPQRDVVQVTRDTKSIVGVTNVVVRDTVTIEGVLAEDTFDWFAQDDLGNVWYFGEDTKEYDAQGNVISTAGSWEAGVNGATPGIFMEASPAAGDTYRQEFAAGVAEDMATISSKSKDVAVPYGTFQNALQTKEFSCLEAGVDYKYYASGVGLILSVAAGSGDERLELVSVSRGG
jgi:hypothetical protein